MSEARLELVETKQVRQFAFDIVMGVLGMDESDMDDQAYASEQVEGWMEHWGKSRQVLSVSVEEFSVPLLNIVGNAIAEEYDKHPASTRHLTRSFRNRLARAALKAAFNLGIQEKADT
jgi:hypothetical protein